MLVVVQLPLLDLRPLLARPVGRLTSPGWPDPVSNEEFVRGVGVIRDRRRGAIYDWPGERAFCDASGLIRFAEGPRFFVKDRGVYPVFRRLYSSGISSRLDVGFEVRNDRPSSFLRTATLKYSKDCLSINVCVGDSDDTKEIGESGRKVALTLLEATTSNSFTERPVDFDKYILPGLPAVLVEHSRAVVSKFSQWRMNSIHVDGYQLEYDKRIIPIWSMATNYFSDRSEARQIRGNLWRLHTERESVRNLMRAWHANPDEFSPELLWNYFARQLKVLVPDERGGFSQSSALAFANSCEEWASPEVLRGLRAELAARSKGILRNLERLMERTAISPGVNSGPVVFFDFHKDAINVNTGDRFEISGKVEGSVVGRGNEIRGSVIGGANNTAGAWSVSDDKKLEVLEQLDRAIEGIKSHLGDDDVKDIESSQKTLSDEKADKQSLKDAARRIVGIATFAGNIGVPVIEAARKVLAALGLV